MASWIMDAKVGVLPRERVLEFLAVFARNGSTVALPSLPAERYRELTRRAARIESLLTSPFGLVNTEDVVNHLALIDRFYGTLTTAIAADPLFAVLEPLEFECTHCSEHPGLETFADIIKGSDDAMLVLTETCVLPGEAYFRKCPRCNSKFFYDRIERQSSTAQRAAGGAPSTCRFRDAAHLLPYIRCHPMGRYAVASATLHRHHAANERAQESAMGVVETLSVAHAVLLGCTQQWAPPQHAPRHLDAAYFRWLILRRDHLMARQRASCHSTVPWISSTPDELDSEEGTRSMYLRFSTALLEDGIVRWAEGHDMTCLLLDDCNIVVADGNHKVKWPCCKFDDVRYVEIPDVAQIPFGCELDRLLTSDVCAFHLNFIGRRTPKADDSIGEAKEVKDFCRADGLAFAVTRRAARRAARRDVLLATSTATSLTSAAYTHSAVEQSAATSSALLSDPAAVPPTAAIGSTALIAAPGQPVTTTTAAGALAAKRKRGVAHVLATSDMDMDDDEEPSVRKLRSKVDRAIDKIVQHRAKRSSALEKLELQRTLADQVLMAKKNKHSAELAKLALPDTTRFDVEFPTLRDQKADYLEDGDARAWHGLGDNAFLVEKIVGHQTIGLTDYHLVKFVGWKKPTLEPSRSNLQKEHVAAYEAAVAAGCSEVGILPIDEAMKPNPNLPLDVVTMSATQFASSLAQSDCGVLKIEQVGEPSAGYLNTTAGVILVGAACRRILLMMPMRNSETTTQTLWMLFLLRSRAPRWAERLKGFCSDMACKVLLHVRAKLRDLPPDSPARPLYNWLDKDLKIFVDNFHIDNHSVDDAFYTKNTHPDLYPELSSNTNTEVCEELFRWWSRFKLMINHMGNAKANYFMQEMRELHNERSLRWDVMSVKFMPAARLAEVRAAYGLATDVSDSTSSRVELAAFLLGQHSRPKAERRAWSAVLLAAHRTRVQGNWREVFAREKGMSRRKAPARD